jgi:hypothetical protein
VDEGGLSLAKVQYNATNVPSFNESYDVILFDVYQQPNFSSKQALVFERNRQNKISFSIAQTATWASTLSVLNVELANYEVENRLQRATIKYSRK